MIARRLLLLVARIMLLIHDHQTQLRHGRKHRRARPHYHPRIPAPNAMPLLRPLIRRQARVQQGHLIRQTRHTSARHRRRQPDLRHQQQRASPGIERTLHRREIHRRLARSRHPIQQVRPKPTLRHRRRNRSHGFHLFLIQGMLVRALLPFVRSAILLVIPQRSGGICFSLQDQAKTSPPLPRSPPARA